MSTPIADAPSGSPLPSSTPPARRPAAPAPLLPVGLLSSTPASVDAFLSHLHRCLQTPSGIDTVVQFACFASRLSAALLTSAGTRVLPLVLFAASPATTTRSTLVVTSPSASAAGTRITSTSTSSNAAPAKSAAAASALVLAQRLRALSGLLSEARMILRLWGLLGLYLSAQRLARQLLSSRRQSRAEAPSTSEKVEEAGEQKDSNARGEEAPTAGRLLLSATQLAAGAAFQVLENASFLSAKGVLGAPPAQQARLARWAARAWAVFVGTEVGRLTFELYRVEEGSPRARSAAEILAMKKNLVRYLAWAPLTVHWGMERGFVGETAIGLLACIPSTIQMRDLWEATAA